MTIEELEKKVQDLTEKITMQQIILSSRISILRQILLGMGEDAGWDLPSTERRMQDLTKQLVDQKLRDLEDSSPELATTLHSKNSRVRNPMKVPPVIRTLSKR